MFMSRKGWQPRLVFWTGAVAVGLISVLFAKLADQSQLLFRYLTSSDTGWWALPVLLSPAGFVAATYLATRFPGSQGSGIPQAIAARHLREPEDRRRMLSIRLIAGKILLTVIGLCCGASIGREGPTVQVGASVMLEVARWGNMARARGLILAGSAAGIAAAFNTPLAGIVFAIEEMGRTYEARTNGLVLTAVILAGLASLALVGNYTYFGVVDIGPSAPMDWLLVGACGIGGGAFGAMFSILTLKATRRLRRFVQPSPLRRRLIIGAICGLGVALIGLCSGGSTFGTGYDQARSAIEGSPVPFLLFPEKLLATLLSTISGIPGGLFAPSLAIGACLGSSIGAILGSSISLAALLGMAGYFAGVVQAPMTTFVIVLEMTGSHKSVIPLMVASMLGYVTARLISNEPLYHALARLFIADALRQKRAEATRI